MKLSPKLKEKLRRKADEQLEQLVMADIQENIRIGHLEEVPGKPGYYRITPAGEAHAQKLMETPEGQEIFRKLEEAYKAGRL